MPRIGIENISVFGMPPVQFVALAADLGCQCISTALTSFPFNIHDYAPFSVREDATLRAEMIAAMRDRDVSISLGEGCTIGPGVGAADYMRDLDLFAELGTERINTVSVDPDLGRTCDEFAKLAELVAERGMRITTELAPTLTVNNLSTALEVLRQIRRPDFRLLIDTMHYVRSGGCAAQLAALDPDLIDYIQLCDAPIAQRFETYGEEAMFERMVPGEGELNLPSLLKVLPEDRVYAIEVPLRSEALAGAGPHERLRKCVEAARQLLEGAHGAPDVAGK